MVPCAAGAERLPPSPSLMLQPHFRDEAAALATLERIVWPQGPVCPHCGSRERIATVTGKGARVALRFCRFCRKQFRATIGTLFEGSHVPMHKWLQACLLLSAGDGRVNAHRLHLHLEVSYKTALSMVGRLARIAQVSALIGVPNPLARHEAEGGSEKPPSEFGSQFRDFVRLARNIGCRDDVSGFERILRVLVSHDPHPPSVRLRRRVRQRRPANTRSTIAGAAPR
jgi:transposase-like protein